MKRKLQIMVLMLLGIVLSINQVWADYTITFNTASSDASNTSTKVSDYVDNSSTAYISSISQSKAYYKCKSGVKLGSSSDYGNITINFSETGKIQASNIDISSVAYDSGKQYKCTVTYTDNSTANSTVNFGTDKNFTVDGTKTIKSIKFETVTKSSGRGYISSFVVTAASGSDKTSV